MNRTMLLLKLILALLAACLSLPALAVELTGQIRGTIADDGGIAVPGVVVNLTSAQLQGGRSTQTDTAGRYRFVGLPPGDYKVEAAQVGFSTAAGTARVAAGLTATVDLVIKPQVAGEEMVVEEVAPTVDTTSTRSGSVLTKEMLRDIPNAGRDYQGAMSFAPGVVDNGTGNPNMRGGLSFGNQYYVDGVNTTDPLTNTFSMNMNFDAIEEFQVITGGMDAEYGRALGGAVNVVTRSGGNTFEGDVQLLYNGTRTQVYKPMEDELNEDGKLDKPKRDDYSLAMNLGGPIMKDRVWFFTGVQLNYFRYTPFLTDDIGRPKDFNEAYPDDIWEMQSRIWKSYYLFGKVTWKPAANHRVWVHFQADPTNIDNADNSVYTLPSAETWWQQGGWLGSIGHQWTPGSRTIVDTQFTRSASYIRSRPMQWKDCTDYDSHGFCTDGYSEADPADVGASWVPIDPDGFAYGMGTYAYYTLRPRTSANLAVTRFEELLGQHQFKAGLQADFTRSEEWIPGYEDPGGVPYYTHNGDPTDLSGYTPYYIVRYDEYYEAELGGQLLGWYLQDAWNPWPRLTLRPGLRFDHSNFVDTHGDSVYNKLTVAPRFGAAYDLTGDGRTRVHAYWGRFYDSGFLQIADLLSKTAAYGAYYWNDKTEDWDTEPFYESSDQFLVHDSLVVPYSDEWDVGLSRDVGDGWALGTVFTYKHTHNMFEDDDVNVIWNADGSAPIGGRDGTTDYYFRLRTPEEAFIKYTSVEVSAGRQFDEHWGMDASYTWSRAYGRYRDDVNQGLASAGFDVAPIQEYEVGLMPYDVPHAVKVFGSYRDDHAMEVSSATAFGYLFGWNMEMYSGTPYEPLWYNDYYGYQQQTSIDGSYRMPATARTDLKAGITLAQGPTKWDLTAECFNVFNSRDTTSVYTEAYDIEGEPELDEDGNILFGQTYSRQNPRYFQLGLRGEF